MAADVCLVRHFGSKPSNRSRFAFRQPILWGSLNTSAGNQPSDRDSTFDQGTNTRVPAWRSVTPSSETVSVLLRRIQGVPTDPTMTTATGAAQLQTPARDSGIETRSRGMARARNKPMADPYRVPVTMSGSSAFTVIRFRVGAWACARINYRRATSTSPYRCRFTACRALPAAEIACGPRARQEVPFGVALRRPAAVVLARCSAPERASLIADTAAVGGTHSTGCRGPSGLSTTSC